MKNRKENLAKAKRKKKLESEKREIDIGGKRQRKLDDWMKREIVVGEDIHGETR